MHNIVQQLKTLQAIATTSIHNNTRVALTCGADASSANENALQNFLSSITPSNQDLIQHHQSSSPLPSPTHQQQKTFFNLPYQVSYAALSIPTLPYTSPNAASSSILSALLTHNHLHREIREKGGAYGGGATNRALPGLFSFYSYRDPNPANTLQIMSDAARWAVEREWTDREIEEAKLTVFQGLDAPVSVNAEGLERFASGVDEGMRQKRREELLDVDKGMVRDAAEGLVGRMSEASFCLLGPKVPGVAREEEGWDVRSLGLGGPAGDVASGEEAAAAAV